MSNDHDSSASSHSWNRLNAIGLAATAIYAGIAIYFSFNNFDDFENLKPQDIATFISGVFSPLAFLWLVLGFFQQGHELRQSAEALRLQGRELQHSVEQQRQLVEATREQINMERDALERERSERARLRMPDLRPKPGGGGSGGQRVQRYINISNFGTACTNLSVTVRKDGNALVTQEWPKLDKGEFSNIQFETAVYENINGYELLITYIDFENNEGISLFNIVDECVDGHYFEFKFVKIS